MFMSVASFQMHPAIPFSCLVAVGQATHAAHDAEHVVVDGIHADLGSARVTHSVRGHRQLESGLVDTREVARPGRLVLLRLEGEGVHTDTRRRLTGMVLIRLNNAEVATLALREAVLAVELQLGNLRRVLALALHTRIQDNLSQEVVGRGLKEGTRVVASRVQKGRREARSTLRQTHTGQERCVGTNGTASLSIAKGNSAKRRG